MLHRQGPQILSGLADSYSLRCLLLPLGLYVGKLGENGFFLGHAGLLHGGQFLPRQLDQFRNTVQLFI